MKIALIIAYFGKWPKEYINYFLDSVERNNCIDVFFVTDLEIPRISPQFKKIHFSFSELSDFISSKLNVQVNLSSPRKLCDLKPMYGFVFSDYISDYEHWAFGDIDVIFGDLGPILSKTIKENDICTFHKNWISGPFTILKNNDYTKSLYKNSPDLDKILKNADYLGFDECGKKYAYLENNKDILNFKENEELKNDIICFSYIILNEQKENKLIFFQKHLIKEFILLNEKVEYRNGKLFFDGKELIHYHLITEKQYYRFKFPKWQDLPYSFEVLHTGMYHSNYPLFLKKLNFRYRIIANEIYRFLGRLYLSLNYRILRKNKKLKYRINVFK